MILKYILDPKDDPRTVVTKKVVTYATVISVISMLLLSLSGRMRIWISTGPLLCCFVSMVVTKRVNFLAVELAIYSHAVYYILGDWTSVVNGSTRSWVHFVTLTDVSLVCCLPSRVSKVIVGCAVLWLLLLAVERSLRFGLFDTDFFLAELPSQATQRERFCGCDTLPCSVQPIEAYFTFFTYSAIFLLDFFFTRGFASALQTEQESMKSVITAAEHIASCLSRLDLESAEQAIESSPLPPPLHTAFSDILANLHIYRPYLPQSCLYENQENSEIVSTEISSERMSASPTSTKSKAGSSSPVHDVQAQVHEKMVSYYVVNLLGTHERIADTSLYCAQFSNFVQKVLHSVRSHNGVVGIVLGDHIHSYFNATKRCASYAQSAVETAVYINSSIKDTGARVSGGVSTGTAHCGSFGCAELMSIGVIGKVAVQASQLERFCRKERLNIATSGTVYREVSHAFRLRIVLELLTMQEGNQTSVYEVLSEQAVKEKDDDEWMYQLDENPWEAYNEAGKHFLMGNKEESLRLLAISGARTGEAGILVESLEGRLLAGEVG